MESIVHKLLILQNFRRRISISGTPPYKLHPHSLWGLDHSSRFARDGRSGGSRGRGDPTRGK